MPVPSRTAAALGDLETPGLLADGLSCEGAKHHSPNPLILRRVRLAPEGERSPEALLCGTCADNLQVLQILMSEHDGTPPWPLRREFGNLIRALAQRGWDHYQERTDG